MAGKYVSTVHMCQWGTYQKLTKRRPAVLAEESGNIISNTLGTSENDALVGAVLHDLLKVLDHLVTLLKVRDDLDNLCDTVVGGQVSGTDVDLNVVAEEIRSELTDILRPGSGPHASLTIRANLADDLANLGLETHVKHTISLVKNEVSDTTKVGAASLEHINQATGSGNANLNTAREVTNLRTLGDTTVDTGVANTGGLSELGNLSLNLDSQLTSRSQNKNNRTIAGGEERLSVDVNNGGETVTQSLSGTSLGNTDDVTSRQSHGPALRLNSSRSIESLGLDLRQNVGGETSLVESLDGAGHVATLNSHLLFLAEGLDLFLRALRNIRVLLVERLFELGHGARI
jgi:hypothetical protein